MLIEYTSQKLQVGGNAIPRRKRAEKNHNNCLFKNIHSSRSVLTDGSKVYSTPEYLNITPSGCEELQAHHQECTAVLMRT